MITLLSDLVRVSSRAWEWGWGQGSFKWRTNGLSLRRGQLKEQGSRQDLNPLQTTGWRWHWKDTLVPECKTTDSDGVGAGE